MRRRRLRDAGTTPDGQKNAGDSPRLHQFRLLTAQEERDLARRVKAGDPAAREELIVANVPLVIHIATHYESSGMTRDDIIQEAVLGLIRAVEKFDPETHGTRLSSYATYWITQAIQRAGPFQLADPGARLHVAAPEPVPAADLRSSAARNTSPRRPISRDPTSWPSGWASPSGGSPSSTARSSTDPSRSSTKKRRR